MSKSVKLSASDARTGRKKKTPMSSSAGARKSQPAAVASPAGRQRGPPASGAAALGCPVTVSAVPVLATVPMSVAPPRPRPLGRAREHPAPLLEQSVHVAVERRERRVHRGRAAHHALAALEHLRHDLLDL